jgi:DNA-directed RNA polymerase
VKALTRFTEHFNELLHIASLKILKRVQAVERFWQRQLEDSAYAFYTGRRWFTTAAAPRR